MTKEPHDRPAEVGLDYGPLGVGLVGVMITAAALVALIVAGLAAADLFPVTSGPAEALTDRGVWAATRAWASPLGLLGLAVLFAGAVPYALGNIRTAIGHRATAMTTSLPALLAKDIRS